VLGHGATVGQLVCIVFWRAPSCTSNIWILVKLFHDGGGRSNHLVAPGACTTRVGALVPRIVVDEDTRVTVQIGRADARLASLRLMARYCDLLGRPAVEGRERGSCGTCTIRGRSDGKDNKRLESKHCSGYARR
jgi:hypothetical protein